MFQTSSGDKAKLVIGGLFILSIFYILLFPITGVYGLQTMIKAKQSEARAYIKNMNLAQQAYRIEYGSFTTELSELNMFSAMPKQANSYVYSIVSSTELDARVTHLAVAKQPDLRSYVGEVVTISNDQTISILCESKQPAQTAPLTPELMDGVLACAPGSRELK